MTELTWRAPQVCRAAGVSYRRLDYLATRGVVVPSVADARGSGSNRRYSTADVYLVAVIAELTRYFRADITELRPVVELLRGCDVDEWECWLAIPPDAPPVLAWFREQLPDPKVMLVVDLEAIVRDVNARLNTGLSTPDGG